jgi:hypothetical protein
MAGDWRRLRNEELGCGAKERRICGGGSMHEMRNTYRILVGKPERKRPLKRT